MEIELWVLLIPFYSAGIMCYSNPNPIWGVWRWHEGDVIAGTRGGGGNHRRARVITLHERQITAHDYSQIISAEEK